MIKLLKEFLPAFNIKYNTYFCSINFYYCHFDWKDIVKTLGFQVLTEAAEPNAQGCGPNISVTSKEIVGFVHPKFKPHL